MASLQQHKYDILATNLLFAGALISYAVDFYSHTGLFYVKSKILSRQFFLVVATISSLLVLAHYYYIRRGYRWAKILFFVFFVLGALFFLVDFKGVIAKQFTSPLKEVNFVVQWISQTAAFILLIISFKNTQWSNEQPPTTADV